MRRFLAVCAAMLASGSVALAQAPQPDRPVATGMPPSVVGAPTVHANAAQRTLDDLARWVAARGGHLSASAIDAGSGSTIAGHDRDRPLNPASNMKVLTAAAVLDRLGPSFVFRTELHGRVVDGGIPDLVVRGSGDPSLTTASLGRLTAALVARGVRSVGNISLDQSRFDERFVPPAFEEQPNEWAPFRAPVSALAVNGNSVTLSVLPAAAGHDARVWFDPPGYVTLRGSVATRPRGSGEGVRLTMHARGMMLEAEVAGFTSEGHARARFDRRVDDPRMMVGYVLAELLRRAGVTVSGTIALGGPSVEGLLSYVESNPLGVLVRELGKQSDNFYAETLLKVLGGEVQGYPATSEHGARALTEWLAESGPLPAGTRVRNGSGLFDANRVSAGLITRTLQRAYLSPKIGPDFVAHLAIAGVDGTLRNRMRAHAASHRIRAKTGTLDRVVALSGYVLNSQGANPTAFSVVVDGIGGAHAAIRQRIDRFVEALTAPSSG